MTTLEAIVDGVPYNLSDGTIAWRSAEEGMGMPPLHRLMQRGPQQNGALDVGYRLDPRMLQLGFMFQAGDWSEHYTRRDQLMRIFRPGDNPIQLRWTLPNGAVRQIDAFSNGGLDFGSGGLFGLGQQFAVELVAPDPTFYDPVKRTMLFNVGAQTTNAFNVPMPVPMAVGVSSLDQTRTVEYEGSWRESPTILIVGPIVSPIITNLTTGETLNFTGTTINAGAWFYIDTRFGRSTVVDSTDVNRVANLTADSDLSTFHLEPTNNDIKATGTGVTSATEIYVSYYHRYTGV